MYLSSNSEGLASEMLSLDAIFLLESYALSLDFVWKTIGQLITTETNIMVLKSLHELPLNIWGFFSLQPQDACKTNQQT